MEDSDDGGTIDDDYEAVETKQSGFLLVPKESLAKKLEPGVVYRWELMPGTFWCIINGMKFGNVPKLCPACGQPWKKEDEDD